MEDTSEMFLANIYRLELERVEYILRSYLRTRLFKIEKNYKYILKNEEQEKKLSKEELLYCKKYKDLIEKHFSKSFLNFIPTRSKSLDEEGMGNLYLFI